MSTNENTISSWLVKYNSEIMFYGLQSSRITSSIKIHSSPMKTDHYELLEMLKLGITIISNSFCQNCMITIIPIK